MASTGLKVYSSSLFGRYAIALYKNNGDQHEVFIDKMLILLSYIHQNKSLKKILFNEFSSHHQIYMLVEIICAVLEFSETVKNFFMVLHQNKRLKFLPEIVGVYRKIYEDTHQISDVKATMAYKSENNLEEKISSHIRKIFGCKTNIQYVYDPSLLGGIILENNHHVVNMSIRNHLFFIEKSLKG